MTLVEFARDSLKSTALAAGSLATLQKILEKPLGPERFKSAIAELTVGVRPDADADLAGALKELAQGRLDRAGFIAKFGHRGSREMELSAPRWSEDDRAFDQVLASADPSAVGETHSNAVE